MQVVKVEGFVYVWTAGGGDDRAKWDDAAIHLVSFQVAGFGKEMEPPNRVCVWVNGADDESVADDATGTEIVGKALVYPLGDGEVRYFLIQLMCCFMDHPMIGVTFFL